MSLRARSYFYHSWFSSFGKESFTKSLKKYCELNVKVIFALICPVVHPYAQWQQMGASAQVGWDK